MATVLAEPHQQSCSPKLIVRDIVTELVGEVETKFAERSIQIESDRRLHHTWAGGGLCGESADVVEAPAQIGVLGEQQLECLCGNVVPCDACSSA